MAGAVSVQQLPRDPAFRLLFPGCACQYKAFPTEAAPELCVLTTPPASSETDGRRYVVLVTENTRDFERIAQVRRFDFVAPWPVPSS
jgi:hypothetical protein